MARLVPVGYIPTDEAIHGMLDDDPELTTLLGELGEAKMPFSIEPGSAYQRAGDRQARLMGGVLDSVKADALEVVVFVSNNGDVRSFAPAKGHWNDYAGERDLRLGLIDGSPLCFRRDQWEAWVLSRQALAQNEPTSDFDGTVDDAL